MVEPDAAIPLTIRRYGFVYVRSERATAENSERPEPRPAARDPMVFPPQNRIGEPMTIVQRAMLQRIAACPTGILWGGIRAKKPPHAMEIPRAPKLGHDSARTIAELWRRGLLSRVAEKPGGPDRIILHERALKRQLPSRIAYEKLRWAAIIELCHELALEWSAFNEDVKRRGRQDQVRPHDWPTRPMIRQRMRAIRARAAPARKYA